MGMPMVLLIIRYDVVGDSHASDVMDNIAQARHYKYGLERPVA